MDHLANTRLPDAACTSASQLEHRGLGACEDLSILRLNAAIEVKLHALADETGIPAEWHNTMATLKNAAGFLLEAAEHIASGDHARGIPSEVCQTPERGIEWALSFIRRVYDGEKVHPVLPL